jgi:hypothetical protein
MIQSSKPINRRAALRAFSVCALILLTSLVACSSEQKKALKAIENYVQAFGARNVEMQAFYLSPDSPDKAYASVVITYNFADASGKFQTEHSGYILRREGGEWAIVKSTNYTTNEQKAMDYLAGRK